MWADRILTSALATQLVDDALSTPDELHRISEAWAAWADDPDAWIALLHGELIARA